MMSQSLSKTMSLPPSPLSDVSLLSEAVLKKRCYTCRGELPVDSFYRDRNAKDGLQGVCKACRKEYEQSEKGKAAKRKKEAKMKYGWSVERLFELFELQGYQCAICGTTEPGSSDWHIDHCHSSDEVRGILCGHCNVGIGMLKDSPDRMETAIQYLRKPPANNLNSDNQQLDEESNDSRTTR